MLEYDLREGNEYTGVIEACDVYRQHENNITEYAIEKLLGRSNNLSAPDMFYRNLNSS